MGNYETWVACDLFTTTRFDPRQETLILTETVTTMSKGLCSRRSNFEVLVTIKDWRNIFLLEENISQWR